MCPNGQTMPTARPTTDFSETVPPYFSERW